MLILHILPDLTPGGAERMMKRLIEAQRDDPHYQHRVISLRTIGSVGLELRALGVEVEALGLKSLMRAPAALWRLVRRIRALDPDIVQTWMYHADLLGGVAARLAGVRRVLWGVRTTAISRDMGVAPGTFWIRCACARVSGLIPSRIIYVCHSARSPHEKLGFNPAKGLVITNGYDITLSRNSVDPQKLREELGLPDGTVLIGSAGRKSREKDHPTFVAAAARLAAEAPEARFVIMGRQLDWDNGELAQLIRDTGFADRFHLLGERKDIAECLAALDIFCLHSTQEGFPNVVGEAMTMGTPCVVTDVGDAALLVGDTGVVVRPRDPKQLAAALAKMLALRPEQRGSLGRQARRRIEEQFSMDAVSRQYAGLYRSLMRS